MLLFGILEYLPACCRRFSVQNLMLALCKMIIIIIYYVSSSQAQATKATL